jgi:hypothetical protein
MQDVVTITLTLAALFFSLMCALLLEELLFGAFFRVLAADAARRHKRLPARSRSYEGGVTCSH